MPNKVSQGAKRWFVGGVAVPLSSKALDHIASRLERAEGKTVLSRGLRASARLVGKRGGKSSGTTPGTTSGTTPGATTGGRTRRTR